MQRRLRVSVGGDPRQRHTFQPIPLVQPVQPIRIDTEGFTGELTFLLREPPRTYGAGGGTSGQPVMPCAFTIQVTGSFKPPPAQYQQQQQQQQQQPTSAGRYASMVGPDVVTRMSPGSSSGVHPSTEWTMDDVLLGIELDRPVPREVLRLPHWALSVCRKWIDRMDAALLLANLVENDPRDWNLRYPRPTVLTPVICAASHMNAWIEPAPIVSPARHPAIVPKSGGQQKSWEHARLQEPHPIWVRDPAVPSLRALAEYNCWMWYGFQPPIATSVDACTRRALYRPSEVPHAQRNALLDIPPSHRRQDHAFETSPQTKYAFDFTAEYFDPTTFLLRPTFAAHSRLEMQEQYGSGYATSLASFLRSSPLVQQWMERWQLDVYRAVRDTDGVARVYVVCRSRPFGPKADVVYFWTLLFELVEEWVR